MNMRKKERSDCLLRMAYYKKIIPFAEKKSAIKRKKYEKERKNLRIEDFV
jgi:hypothetical protein